MANDDGSSSEGFLVVTGSSAGGIDALIAFVGGLPGDFRAPLVVAQHQAPAHASRLVDILSTKTTLPVLGLDHETVLQAGTIYVVGSDRDVEVLDGAARVVTRPRKGPKPSIDRLFSSAAESHGERLIAIIFSGMGSDGLAGARIVKEHGGTVIVQAIQSASFPAMPMAIPPNLVDVFARPDAIGAMLAQLVRVPLEPGATKERNLLRALLVELRERSGIDFSLYKMPTIMRRLSRLMISAGIDSIEDYVRYLRTNPDAYQRTVNAFLIKVTEFFRDAPLFERLRTEIIPQLFATALERRIELRIWSAGTSTGEEAYSLAIICAELLRERGDDVGVRIFATDLDEQAIAFARRGTYSYDALREIPPAILERYFTRVGEAYEVGKRIRNMTVFGQHDLAQRAPFPRIDLCLCRNVLIYFTKDLQSRALHLFAFSLRDGGYLVVGKAEVPSAVGELFRVVDPVLKIYQRQGERPPLPLRSREALPAADIARFESVPAASAVPRDLRAPLQDALGLFTAGASVGVVALDRRYDIVAMNRAARAMLEIHGMGVGEDLLHLVRNVDAGALRAVIDRVFAGDAIAPKEFAVSDPAGGNERWLLITATDRIPSARGDLVALFVIDVTESVVHRRGIEKSLADAAGRVGDVSGRLDELAVRQRQLLQANAELSEVNTELRTVNEQLLISAEEAASANEEIETLNEEMQATNEELETLNEELQATVEELNTSNDELEARGSDLERAAGNREEHIGRLGAERNALNSALEALDGTVLIVRPSDERVVYIGPPLELTDFDALEAGWSTEASIAIAGASYALTREAVEVPPYAVFQLRRLP
jgi:two-component system, chemotaxis family, CheB/CheR fusion protein